ncbi:uncharacterized protein Bfra_011079 [Botrytis fragariae]|uniref:Uncharacterized protein n=1 Tax=Botrytis fragariae TaxID=1964551 RepID=A0A8H6AL01_9HELO|nr:uncharacterized protein Bfra_011079 [Botrytis fragariae]KAF5869271.1 hypothetical protein Bfra_011079 [Botrytis fragariae]
MCVDTLITYTACNCKIMIKTICFDHIQHTLKQEDRNPCPKEVHGLHTIRTSPNTCFLKSGSKLEDGRIFRHGSHRTRNYYEFERDPNDPKKRWERWERKNRGKTRQRADSMEANISAGEDRMMNLEADNNDSHKERESQIREWQEETKNNRPPRVKVEEKVAEKEQLAPGRKTVNNVLYDISDPRSDDEFSDDDDWKPESKVEVDPGDTVPWSSNNPRSFSDPTRASGNNTNQDAYTSPKSRNDGALFRDDNTHAFNSAEPDRPATPHSQFNFNPPFTGTHTKYHLDKSSSSHGSSSARTKSVMDLGSPKHRAPIPAKVPPRRHDLYRPRYPSMPVDANTSFWAGHLNQVGSSRPPPYFPSPWTLAPHNAAAGGLSSFEGVGRESTASANGGSAFADGETRGVYGNYTDGENHERENKKARVERSDAGNLYFDNTCNSTRDHGSGGISRDEGEKQTANSMNDAGDDIEMVE